MAKKQAKGRGRAPRDIDLKAIEAEAAAGVWKVRTIGRLLGIPGSTLLGPKHKDAVLEAVEVGKARFEKEALRQYNDLIHGVTESGKGVHPSAVSALIFKMKQIGWTDKLQHSGPGDGPIHLELEGAAERFLAQVEKYIKKQAAGQ
jgi:hypothetical protein